MRAVPTLLLLLLVASPLTAQSIADLSVWQGNASFVGSGLDRVGTALATGDVNGDGRWDLAIGAPGALNNSGQVYLFYGTNSLLDSTRFTDLPSQADLVITGTPDLQLGITLHLGDINGDSREDLIIGAPRAGSNRGEVWIIFGAADLGGERTSPDVRIVGGNAGDSFGAAIASSDVDPGDDIQDLLIGAPGADPYGRDAAGRVDVILGRSAGWPALIEIATTPSYATIMGPVTGAKLGTAIARAASFQGILLGNDINSDGIGDVIMGAPGQTLGGRTGSGFVHLFLSNDSVVDTVNLAIINNLVNYRRLGGANFQDGIGRSLASFTTANRRGLLVGSPNALVPTNPTVRGGAVYEVNWNTINTQEGVIDLANLANFRQRLMSSAAGDSFGVAVSAVGGLWAMGATGADPYNRSNAGYGHLFPGPPNLQGFAFVDSLSSNHVRFAGSSSLDRIAGATAIGDLNGDGVLDGIYGSGSAGNFSGRVHVVKGGMPYAWEFTPSPGQSNVPIGTSITFSARDDSPGLNPDLSYMTINHIRYFASDPEVSWESENGRYDFLIQPSQPFPIDVPIPVVYQLVDNSSSRSPLYSFQFVTGRDDRAPEVADLSPAENEVNVATTRNVEFTLVDPGSGVDTLSVSVRIQFPGSDETIVWGDPRLTATGLLTEKRFTCDPGDDLPADEVITITLRGQDLTVPPNVMTPFTYHFSTISDTLPPVITLIHPAPGTVIDVSTSILIRIQDQSAGVNADSTLLLREQGGEPEPASLAFSSITGGFNATHTPGINPFLPGPLNLTLTTRDLANPPNLLPDTSWNYTVIRDTIPPRLAGASPAPLSGNAARNTPVILNIRDNAAGVDSTTLSLTIAGSPIHPNTILWRSSDRRNFDIEYRVNPANPYPDTVWVSMSIRDRAIPPNSLDTTYYFTTERDTTRPEILLIQPAPGSDGVSVNEQLIWEVTDNMAGVNPASPFLIVNDVEETANVVSTTAVTQPGAEYRFIFTPQTPFAYEDTLSIRFDIYDFEVPGNRARLNYELFTEPDEHPPYLADRSPYPGETSVSRGADILFKLLDRGLGVELDSLVLFVQEQHIQHSALAIEPVDSGYVVRYNPPGLFSHQDSIHVRVVAYDKARVPNRMDIRYWFLTLSDDREPPYVSDLVPADSTTNWPVSAGFEFTILDDGQGVDSAFTRIQRVGDPLWRFNAEITPVNQGLHYLLSLTDNWLYSDTATITILARDQAEPPNEMTFPTRVTLFIERDDLPPIAVNQSPPPDSGITSNRFMSFDLTDDLSGVDTSTVSVLVDDLEVRDLCEVTLTSLGYHYRYRPAANWNLGDRVAVAVAAGDLSAGRNQGVTSWEFDIIPDLEPPFVAADSLFPAPGASGVGLQDTLRIMIFDEGVGIDPNRLEVTLAGKSLNDLAAPDSVELGYEFSLPLSRLNLFQGQLVEVRIDAFDKSTPANRMARYSYQFTMAPPADDFAIVPTTFTPNGDGVWDEALIYHLGGSGASVAIFDIRGRKVATVQGSPARWNGLSDTGEPVPGGLYIVQVTFGGKVRQATVAVAR